jgi:UDP-glucose 4-epimerase
VVKLAARRTLPLFHPVAEALTSALWAAGTSPVPPSFLRYLRFVCVADGEQAARKLGFRPAYTTREALADWVSARGLRDAHLLQDAPA